jgi:hypothetical protein
MKTKHMEITPNIAADMLEQNTANRPLSEKHAKKLAREMELGRWQYNGDAIRFTKAGKLIDGQHRLAAVILSGTTITTLVVEDLDDEVFSTIDANKPRSGSDTLAHAGVANASLISAALKVVHLVSSGRGDYIGKWQFTNADVQELYDEHPAIVASAYIARRQKICSGSVMAGLHYLFAQIDPEEADRFVNDVQSGSNLSDGDGVYHFRERVMQNIYMRRPLTNNYVAALAIKAWNARRTGRRVGMLRYLESEQFPIIAE